MSVDNKVSSDGWMCRDVTNPERDYFSLQQIQPHTYQGQCTNHIIVRSQSPVVLRV